MNNVTIQAAGGYGPPGGGYPPGGGGGGGFGPPPGGAPPGGGGFGPPPGGGGFGPPPGGAPPGGGGFGPPPGGGGFGPPPGGYGPPPGGGGFGPPPGGFPPGGPMMPGAGGDVNTVLPLILNIVSLLFCCWTTYGFGGLISIAGLVLAIIAMNSEKSGNIQDAQAKAKLSLILGIVSIVLGFLAIIGWVALGAFANMG